MDKIKNRKIIVDSCILIYYFEDLDKGETKRLINSFKRNNNTILMSAISVFEVFKNRQTSKEIKKYENLLNSVDDIPIDSPILMNAATLYYLYKKEKDDKNSIKEKNVDPKDRLTGDLIIGGTVLSYENYLLLTANKKDFPDPFWDTIATTEIGKNAIKVYLIQFNIQLLPKETPLIDPKDWKTKERKYFPRG